MAKLPMFYFRKHFELFFSCTIFYLICFGTWPDCQFIKFQDLRFQDWWFDSMKSKYTASVLFQESILTWFIVKEEKVLKGSLDSIPSPSPSVIIQIIGRKACLRWKGKILLGIVNRLLKTKKCWHQTSSVLPYLSSKLSHQ